MRLEPQSQFVLARGLPNHLDGETYYVQAVIRDGRTDQLIDTVNLTDNGDRRFTKPWRVPADPTGEGRDILITYTVYTDSGYMVKSENHEENFISYRIEHLPRHGGGGGADVDYKRVEKIVAETVAEKLAALPKPEPFPEMPNMAFHLQPLINSITGLRNDIQAVEIPPTDFSGVEYRLDTIEKAIQGITKTLKATNLPDSITAPVLDAISALEGQLKPNMEAASGATKDLLATVKQFSTSDLVRIGEQVTALKTAVDHIIQAVFELRKQEPKVEEPEPINYPELLRR